MISANGLKRTDFPFNPTTFAEGHQITCGGSCHTLMTDARGIAEESAAGCHAGRVWDLHESCRVVLEIVDCGDVVGDVFNAQAERFHGFCGQAAANGVITVAVGVV